MKTPAIFLLFALVMISCRKSPSAYFTIGENYDDHYVEINEDLILTGQSTHGKDFLWDFGDGTTAQSESVTHSWSEPGDYKVKLTVANGKHESSYEREIRVTGYAYKYSGMYTGITTNTSSGCGTSTESVNLLITASPFSDSLGIINLANRVGYTVSAVADATNTIIIPAQSGLTFSDGSVWNSNPITLTWTEAYNQLLLTGSFSDENYANSCVYMSMSMNMARAN